MRCPDPPAHPSVSGALRGPLRAAAAVAGLAACGWAVTALAPFWAVALLLEAAMAVALMWAVQRRVRYWGWRKPRPAVRREVAKLATSEPVRAPYKIQAPPLAIEGRPVTPAVVPGARNGAKVEA